jgi:hypothetical protein
VRRSQKAAEDEANLIGERRAAAGPFGGELRAEASRIRWKLEHGSQQIQDR